MSPLFPAGDHAVRHAHGGGVADGIDGCHHERFGSPGRRVDETAVCDRPGTRRHPSATIAAGIACADLRIQTVCRTRHRQRDRDRRRLFVHLVPGDRSSRMQLPTMSQTWRLFVAALAVSVPAGTLVVRLKLASAAFARPDSRSLAVHAMVTSLLCHAPSAAAHDSAAASRPPGLARQANRSPRSPRWCSRRRNPH